MLTIRASHGIIGRDGESVGYEVPIRLLRGTLTRVLNTRLGSNGPVGA